jgi:iron complex outermembrane receptor protein
MRAQSGTSAGIRRGWHSLLGSIAVILGIAPVYAQHVADNAVVAADDAFGLSVGTESVGLYTPDQVRGFSPQTAGNVRIGGLYFDQQTPLSPRVIEGSAIRVGISAVNYPFPAPTGIADFDLRHVGDKPALTLLTGGGPFRTRAIDLDGQFPVPRFNLKVPLGISRRNSTDLEGYTTHELSAGLAPQWTPRESIEVRAFWDGERMSTPVVPEIVMDGGATRSPPHLPSAFLGQHWARWESVFQNYGALVQAKLNGRWTIGAGLFRSVSDSAVGYSDQYLGAQPTGLAGHVLIAYPDQRNSSTSGELRLTGQYHERDRRHDIVLSVRGREMLAWYGGEDSRLFGTVPIDRGAQIPRPDFQLRARTSDRNRLWMAGIAYQGQWLAHGGLSLGLQKAGYRGTNQEPGQMPTRRADRPWRAYGAVTLSLTAKAALYAGYTQGIEDAGGAPSNATNRGQVLPASRTWQRDAGVQYRLNPKIKWVAGVFEVHEPYFNLDASGAFVNLGDQNHRGFEFSIAGEFIKDLNIVAGIELLNPRVVTRGVSPQRLGPRAVGQGDHFAQLNIDYKLQSWPAFSIDLAVNSYGRQAANLENTVFVPGTQSLDIGSRYQFHLHTANASLRLFVLNTTNAYRWNLTEAGAFMRAPARSVGLYLTLDL